MRSRDTGEPIYLISQMRDISARKKAGSAWPIWKPGGTALASVGQGFWDHNVLGQERSPIRYLDEHAGL